MYTNIHAAANVKTVPDAATDEVLDGSYAGWDATIYIPEPGVDPFEGIDDDDLLHAHAGVMAATVMAQANQMRVLDSAIVPDRDLVRPTEGPAGKFNEFEVYTPMTAPERYTVINEDGIEEVVVPSAAFYPGLSERSSAAQTAISLKLEEEDQNPYAVALAMGTALLQIGVEAGRDVGPVADILNAAWGLTDAFSPATVVGLAGTHDYAAIFAQDRNTNARRAASWQETSYVRSGQLAMQTSDWGPDLHCDFRRARVAGESLFATSMAAETRAGGRRPTGKIVYHVPATSMLSAHPSYMFFTDAAPELFPKQPTCLAAAELLDKVGQVGLLRALWPSTEPEIASTWAATFATKGGLARAPVTFVPRTMTAAPLFAAATSRIVKPGKSVATGLGRTVMTTLSAKLAALAENVVDVQTVGWLARFAAVVETMRLSTDKSARIEMASRAWTSLNGGPTRDLERSLSKAHMAELKKMLPVRLSARLTSRSARIPVYAVLLEVGNPATSVSHTVLRGLRRAFGRAAEVAMAVTVRERVGWKSSDAGEWLSSRLAVVREFWAVQFAALAQVAHIAEELRSDLRWWVEVAAAVNTFRAGVMRGFAVAAPHETPAFTVRGVEVRLKPYHAAAHLRKALTPYFMDALPEFHPADRISDWARRLCTHTADIVSERKISIPRVGKVGAASDHTSHFARGAELLATERALGDWIERTTELVADDCEALLERRSIVVAAAAPQVAAPMSEELTAAFVQAAANMAEAMAKLETSVPVTELYDAIEEDADEDAWDDFVEAAWDESHPKHEAAARQLAAAKACTDPATAASIARWIDAEFGDDIAESSAAII